MFRKKEMAKKSIPLGREASKKKKVKLWETSSERSLWRGFYLNKAPDIKRVEETFVLEYKGEKKEISVKKACRCEILWVLTLFQT